MDAENGGILDDLGYWILDIEYFNQQPAYSVLL